MAPDKGQWASDDREGASPAPSEDWQHVMPAQEDDWHYCKTLELPCPPIQETKEQHQEARWHSRHSIRWDYRTKRWQWASGWKAMQRDCQWDQRSSSSSSWHFETGWKHGPEVWDGNNDDMEKWQPVDGYADTSTEGTIPVVPWLSPPANSWKPAEGNMPAEASEGVALSTQGPEPERCQDSKKSETAIQIWQQDRPSEQQAPVQLGRIGTGQQITVAQVMHTLRESGCRTLSMMSQMSDSGIHVRHTIDGTDNTIVNMQCPGCELVSDCLRITNSGFLCYGKNEIIPAFYRLFLLQQSQVVVVS